MDKDDRHAFGAHYTSPVDIMKIVKPTISDPWNDAIESAKSPKKLNDLLERLTTLRVLDPACGSGNFLYLAYREMKRLETRIRERLITEFPKDQPRLIHVNARQFFGMDINSFAIELAKVSMMIGRKLAIDELHVADEKDLPLDNLDANFKTVDALISFTGESNIPTKTPWPAADVIIGNPPFLGSRYLAQERGYEYVRVVYELYPEIPKMADYCVYWFRRANEHLPTCEKADPLSGRAGLVGTQNIRNNEAREGGLDHVVSSGVIIEAVDDQPWSGDANVHVSIVNWVKTQDKSLLPKKMKLWKRLKQLPGVKIKRVKGELASKKYELVIEECDEINAAISGETDVTAARELACNTEPQRVFQGQNPANEDFMIEPEEAKELIRKNPKLKEVLFPYMIGRDLVDDGVPSRWIIDFAKKNLLEASSYPIPFEKLKATVMPAVLARAQEERKATGKDKTRWTRMAERWWQFRDYQPGTMNAIFQIPRYIVCSRTTKRPIFAFLSKDVHPDTKLMVFPFADDYSFGILQSHSHWLWFVTKCSKLKSDFSYTPSSVYDTFPWPQSPSKKQVDAVAAAAVAVRKVRAEALAVTSGGLRAVYRTLELPGKHPLKDAHAALDKAVLDAYGFDAKKDLLAQLLELNLTVSALEKQGKPVTSPGIPKTYGDATNLITKDCIKP